MAEKQHTQAPSRRLFFACWPEEGIRRQIVELRRLIDGLSPRRVPDHNLHLTLLFLGNQPAHCLPDLRHAVSGLGASAFELSLDQFGWFPGARVAWLGGPAPAVAENLVLDLSKTCRALGLQFDQRPFHPHVTLFRKVERRPTFPAVSVLRWPVSEFALIESIPSRPYQVLRTWPLKMSSNCCGLGLAELKKSS